MNENAIEGRNAVLEAFRAGKTVDKLYVQEGLKDGPILSIVREAKKQGSRILYSATAMRNSATFSKARGRRARIRF